MVQEELGVKVPVPAPGEKSMASPMIEPELPDTAAVQSVPVPTVTGLGVQDREVEVVARAELTVRPKMPSLPALTESPP
jgi:hypothetical protein